MRSGIWRGTADFSPAETVTPPPAEQGHRGIRFLPGGNGHVYAGGTGTARGSYSSRMEQEHAGRRGRPGAPALVRSGTQLLLALDCQRVPFIIVCQITQIFFQAINSGRLILIAPYKRPAKIDFQGVM